MTIAGFGTVSPGVPQFIINGTGPSQNISEAITDAIVEVTIHGASTLTIELTDPTRTILNSGLFEFGASLTFDGLNFTLVQFTKSGDQLELVFESAVIYALGLQRGVTAAYTGLDVAPFIRQLVNAVPNSGLVIDPTPLVTPTTIQRGSSEDPLEDSWTCIQRLATTIGWRAFEYKSVVYFASDPFLLNQPNLGTIKEFTLAVQNIDFDWDTQKPFGDMTVTGMAALWTYPPGQPISVVNVGPPSGTWLVADCQRDVYNPQCSVTLTVPLTPQESINQQTEASEGTTA